MIPVGPITQAERDACEVVLALDPQPEQYADDQGRLWTPCVSWWVGEKIPDWPPGVWPGQVEYLRRPVDAADWLGCIAGYLVYKGPLKVAVEKNYPDEAATVEITKLLTARREVLRAHMIERLAALGRQNAVNDCGAVDVVLPACAVDPKWPKTEEAAAKAWLTIEVAARKRINQYKASRSIDPISGVPGDGWTAKAGPYWRWVLGQSLGPAFVLAKITSGPCVWESDEFSPMGKRLAVLADDVAATVGDAP